MERSDGCIAKFLKNLVTRLYIAKALLSLIIICDLKVIVYKYDVLCFILYYVGITISYSHECHNSKKQIYIMYICLCVLTGIFIYVYYILLKWIVIFFFYNIIILIYFLLFCFFYYEYIFQKGIFNITIYT